MLPCFGDLVAGHPSRMLQPRACVLILATCSQVEAPVRGVHRDFRDSASDSLTSRPSSHEKHLENFFTILSLSVLATCPGDLLATHPSRKRRVFGKKKVSF